MQHEGFTQSLIDRGDVEAKLPKHEDSPAADMVAAISPSERDELIGLADSAETALAEVDEMFVQAFALAVKLGATPEMREEAFAGHKDAVARIMERHNNRVMAMKFPVAGENISSEIVTPGKITSGSIPASHVPISEAISL